MSPLRAGVLTVVQYAAGIAAAGLVSCMFPGTSLSSLTRKALKLNGGAAATGSLNVRTTLSPGTSIVRGLFIETFCTFLLMLAIIMCAAEKNVGSFIAPLPIGLALFVAELASGKFSDLDPDRFRSLRANAVLLFLQSRGRVGL